MQCASTLYAVPEVRGLNLYLWIKCVEVCLVLSSGSLVLCWLREASLNKLKHVCMVVRANTRPHLAEAIKAASIIIQTERLI